MIILLIAPLITYQNQIYTQLKEDDFNFHNNEIGFAIILFHNFHNNKIYLKFSKSFYLIYIYIYI